MWELDHKEGWALKNWCFWTVVLEETLESPLDCKEIKPVNRKGSKPWIFTEALAPILWPPDARSQLTGKDWRLKEKEAAEDEMVREYHWLIGHESEQTLGDSEGQRSLAWCCPWGCRVRHDLLTEQQQMCVCVCVYGSAVKNLPAVQKTWVWSLDWDNPLEEGMAMYASILAWRIAMDRGSWRAAVHEVAKIWTQLSD